MVRGTSLADRITWYVQAIMHVIYEHTDATIDRDLVNTVLSELIEEQSATYQSYCVWLTGNQLDILRAIACEGYVQEPLSHGFASAHRLPSTSSIKTALKSLSDKMLVSKTPQGYCVSDRFFAHWLKR